MTPLYLRHRSDIADLWTLPPNLATAFPTMPSGALPVTRVRFATRPEIESPCGCTGDAAADDHLILYAECAPIPLALAAPILTFLLQFKQASLHEAKMTRFGLGNFMTASISNIESNEVAGRMHLSLRLAVPLSTALT